MTMVYKKIYNIIVQMGVRRKMKRSTSLAPFLFKSNLCWASYKLQKRIAFVIHT